VDVLGQFVSATANLFAYSKGGPGTERGRFKGLTIEQKAEIQTTGVKRFLETIHTIIFSNQEATKRLITNIGIDLLKVMVGHKKGVVCCNRNMLTIILFAVSVA